MFGKSRNLLTVYSSIIVAMIFWSLSFIWYKDAYQNFGPMATVFLRLLLSAFLLGIISFSTKRLKVEKGHFKLFVLAAMFEPFLYFIGESFGMQMVSPVTASVIIATIPILTPIATSFMSNEKLTSLNIFGIIISFLGVSIVILNKGLHFEASIPGVLLMFVAVFSAIGYALALKKLTPHYEPVTIVAIQNMIGTVLFAPLFFIFDFQSFLNNVSFIALVPIINLSIFASSLAFILYAYGVNAIGVSKANTFTNLIPVLTCIFAYFLLNERINFVTFTGILIVVGGLFLSQVNVAVYMRLANILVWKKNTKK